MVLAVPALARSAEPPAVTETTVPYYVAEGGETRGPVGLDVLLGEIRDGAVMPWTLVWKPGLSGWIRAGSLPELGKALAEATPRPPPPPPQPPALPAELPEEAIYFVADGGTARGPLTETEILAAIGAGELTSTMLVWWPGSADWVEAGAVPELAERFIVSPPAVPARETIRQFMTGRWEFTPRLADAPGTRTVLTLAPDMTFSGSVEVVLDGAAGEARPVAGTWDIGAAGQGGFTLLLWPKDGGEGATSLRIVDDDTLAAEDGETTARRLPG